jgi:hypothetical protein
LLDIGGIALLCSVDFALSLCRVLIYLCVITGALLLRLAGGTGGISL